MPLKAKEEKLSDPAPTPPAWPLRLLRSFLKKEYIEEIEGDLEELFHDLVEQRNSYTQARRAYVWQVLTLLRPVLLKNVPRGPTINAYPMYRNYFKTSFRSIVRQPLTAFINVFGLSVAIGICLLVYIFMAYDQRIDLYHVNKDEIHLATLHASRDGISQQYGITPRPLGEAIKQDLPHVKEVCRIDDGNVVVKYNEHVIHEHMRFADPSFLRMFTFPLKWGSPAALEDLNSIVLSEDMSTKYFGDENPIGRMMTVIFNDSAKKEFMVGGVAARFPSERDLDFGLLVHFDNLRVAHGRFDSDDWSKFIRATWVQLDNPQAATQVNAQLSKYQKLHHEALPEWAISSFTLEPLTTLHERSSGIRDAIVLDTNLEARIGLPIIAFFMIVLACFNYINIAIVSASKRLKEIGVRKVIGANRLRVIVQFLAENVFVTILAMLIGIALCYFLFLPWFGDFTGWPLDFHFLDPTVWLFLLMLVIFTGVVSGIYPAFYISRFEASHIFRGSLKFGNKNPLTRIFLGAQIVLSCMTITAGVVLTQNNRYQYDRDWGYDHRNLMYVQVPHYNAFERMKAGMHAHPDVIASAGSADHVGRSISRSILRTASEQQLEVDRIAGDGRYVQTLGLDVVEGSALQPDVEADTAFVLVNETLVKELAPGKETGNAVGQYFDIDGARYQVVGVVRDVHFRDFFHKVRPAVFMLAQKKDFRFLTMRLRDGAGEGALVALKDQWAKHYPEIPFQGGHQQDVWSNYFFSVDRSQEFTNIVATVAVLLAGLGLYGLVTLNISGRVKEFSIRKTLGAGLSNIAGVIAQQYAVLVIVSIALGVPASYLFTKAYLDMLFAYPMPMGLSGSIIAVVILVTVLCLVISTQITKVHRLNPVEGLKSDQ